MRIRRVKLVNFRLFRDREVEFGRGLNFIVGPNEAGKSTIVEGIATALFCDVASTAKTLKDLERWGSKGAMRLELDFEHDGETYRLLKDFGARRAVLEKGDGSETIGDRGEVEARLREMIGFREQQAFESVAAVRQGELAALEGKAGKARRSDLLPMIERKMTSSSGATDAAGVIGQLDKAIAALGVGVRSPAKNPGPIKRLMDEKREITAKIAESRRQWEQNVRLRNELAADRANLAKATEQKTSVDRTLETEKTRSDAARELEEVERELERNASQIGKIRKLRSDIAEAYGQIDEALPEQGKLIEEARRDVEAAGERIAKLEGSAPPGDWRGASGRPGVTTMVLGLVALGALFAPIYAPTVPGVRLWSVLLGVALAAAAVFLYRRGARLRAFRRDVDREIGERDRAEETLGSALGRAGVATYEDYSRAAARQQELRTGIGKSDTILLELAGEESADAFEENLQASGASQERRKIELERKLQESGGADGVLAAVEVAGLRNESAAWREKIEELTRRTTRKTALLEGARDEAPLPDLEARLEIISSDLERVGRRERVLRLAHEGLVTALERTKRDASAALAPLVSRVLAGVTLGRYSEVSVATDLEFSVTNPDPIEGAPATLGGEELSAGTVDQLYLAVRYGLLEFLSGPGGAPFVLDDVLVHFDPERRQAAIGVLREIARERQVILLACENHLAGEADEIVRLTRNEATSGRSAGEPQREMPRES